MPASPSATDISVREVLAKFDGEFAATAQALESGEFALWIGSGISRGAPSLGLLIARAIEALRERARDPAQQATFEPAFLAAVKLAGIAEDDARPHFDEPFSTWPMAQAMTDDLWNKYSRLLDIRIAGQPSDWMLWDAVDVRDAFANPLEPGAPHLCIAILILEGAVRDVASANWDGFIEAAVRRLSSAAPLMLQTVVDPDHLREAAGRARLLKFHGCIVYATDEPATFRKYLTGSHTQIVNWRDNPDVAAMRQTVTQLATNRKSLVLGLSIQDANLQGVFSAARQLNPWPWPCAPHAPGHVFCEDEIKDGQRDVLKIVYGDAYNDDAASIETGAHLRAWGEQVLMALTLKLVADKIGLLMAARLASDPIVGAADALSSALASLRDDVAERAVGDRTAFLNNAVAAWSRLVAIFRTGAAPTDAAAYEILSASPLDQLAADQNAVAAGLGSMGIALGLLQHGRTSGLWDLEPPADADLSSGALTAVAGWAGAGRRPVFLVRGAAEAIALEQNGAFANDNAIVIHADATWHQMRGGSAGGARRPRGAPGRTGRVETHHVSVAHLLSTSSDFGELGASFIAEVTL